MKLRQSPHPSCPPPWLARMYLCPVIAVITLMLCTACDAKDHFIDHVAPILQRRCLSCHNDAERKGDFSLQTADSAMADGFFVSGDAKSSHVIDVITPVDGRAKMPKDADPLTDKEVNLIRTWINDGAVWPANLELHEPAVTDFDWWSYQPIKQPGIPNVNDQWVRTPIDAFVLQTLNQQGLTHASEADRHTLIRRLTYDLIGLPPSPEEVAAFVGEADPQAYEKLVDRLLASPHYGERWARHWLDVVKYADTCGYDKDKLRPNAWPYRDYVIRSFNEDKPYARFVQEQIAGDVLFPGDPDGILGLGFIAAGPWDFIGHVEVPESKLDGKVARNLDRDDMVSNTLNTFCSVTVQCARCHNHKFDPITQEHYYGLQSLFAAVDRADRPYDLDPDVEKQRTQLTKQLTNLQNDEKKAAAEIAELGGPRLTELQTTIASLQAKIKVIKEPEFGYHSATSTQQDAEKWVEIDLGKDVDVSQIVLRPCHDDYGGIGAGFGFPVRFRVAVADGNRWYTVFDATQADFPNPGLSPVDIQNVSRTTSRVRITATRLADRKDVFIMALAELQVLLKDGSNAAIGTKVTSLDSIEAPVRWGRQNLTDGRWARGGDPEIQEQLTKAIKERDQIMAPIATPERLARDDGIRKAINDTQAKLKALPTGRMVYAAATNFTAQGNFKPTEGKLRAIQVLHRGNIQQPKADAVPGFVPLDDTKSFRIDAEANDSQRRAALANWLTSKDHPLVWRSIVNRIWQYHFGQGIVATPNDFGRMGAQPTHPELLDWLATQFRDSGQSMKNLHRMIVLSSVYRQASTDDSANSAIDGSNQYLWRMNRRRLEAEEIRDSILSVSGAMNLEMGGPGFYLFALEKTAHSPHYEYHKFDPRDEASHRRSIYRFIARSQPNPWMTTLDCADSSQSTPKRNETLTSLQALSLLNNRFNLVMGERFAQRLQSESPDITEQVRQAFALVTQRTPTDDERNQLTAYANQHGMNNLCRFLFNLSEFVFLD